MIDTELLEPGKHDKVDRCRRRHGQHERQPEDAGRHVNHRIECGAMQRRNLVVRERLDGTLLVEPRHHWRNRSAIAPRTKWHCGEEYERNRHTEALQLLGRHPQQQNHIAEYDRCRDRATRTDDGDEPIAKFSSAWKSISIVHEVPSIALPFSLSITRLRACVTTEGNSGLTRAQYRIFLSVEPTVASITNAP